MNGRHCSFLSLAFFVLLLGMFFRPIAFGKIPFPSDALVGLYHPFRDLYQRSFPNGVPFKNFLLTDPVLQTYPWREFAIDEIKHGRLPLWNPYTFSGTPLFANIQSAVLNPFNIFLFIFPFLVGWVILIVLQPLLGGLFFFLYARKLNLHPLAAIFGGVSWVMGGFFLDWVCGDVDAFPFVVCGVIERKGDDDCQGVIYPYVFCVFRQWTSSDVFLRQLAGCLLRFCSAQLSSFIFYTCRAQYLTRKCPASSNRRAVVLFSTRA